MKTPTFIFSSGLHSRGFLLDFDCGIVLRNIP
nr:MAG TPA: hypothetical protein [Caudoviricetes sp.]